MAIGCKWERIIIVPDSVPDARMKNTGSFHANGLTFDRAADNLTRGNDFKSQI